MANYIENPMTHPEWDPKKGDYFSKRVYEEDLLHEKNLFKKKILVSSLISIHMVMLAVVFFYFS